MTNDPPLPRYHDLTGQTFSRLKVLSYAGKAGAVSTWLCRCSCGKLYAALAPSPPADVANHAAE